MAGTATLVTTGLNAINSTGDLIELDNLAGTDPAITCGICMEEIGDADLPPGYVGHRTTAATADAVAQDHFFCKRCMERHEQTARRNARQFTCPICRVHLHSTNGSPDFERRTAGARGANEGPMPVRRPGETHAVYLVRLRAFQATRRINRGFRHRHFHQHVPPAHRHRRMHRHVQTRIHTPAWQTRDRSMSISQVPCLLKLPALISKKTGLNFTGVTFISYALLTLATVVGIIAIGIIFPTFIVEAILWSLVALVYGTFQTFIFAFQADRIQLS